MTYTDTATILGIKFGATIEQTIDKTWTEKIENIQGSVKDFYIRKLDIRQRKWVSNTWFLSKVWYTAQILPILDKYAQQITTVIIQYIWRGWIFRIPVTTLYKRKLEGGLGMTDTEAKCDTLYFARLEQQRQNKDIITAHWLTTQQQNIQRNNPPNWAPLPHALEYLRK
jgi:hypothetical protein